MTATAGPPLCISIVSYHAAQSELEAAISSLLLALQAVPSAACGRREIVIVDNSENSRLELDQFAGLQPRLDQSGCQLRLLQGQGNVGYGAGHNLAITQSVGGYQLLMNVDVVLERAALAEGLRFLSANPEVAAVSPRATCANGHKQYLCKQFPAVFDFLLRGFAPAGIKQLFRTRLARFEMHELAETAATKGIPIISGCCMLCRTEALQTVGGFNEDYFLYFEDFDLSMRLNAHYALAYLPTMKIVHHGGNAARKGLVHLGWFIRSAVRFFNTWGWRWF